MKTKFIHVYHPKVIDASHQSSSPYLLHRKDPTYQLVNGGYPQPLVKSHDVTLTADDYHRWRRDQMKKAIEHQKRNAQPIYEEREVEEADEEENDDDNHDKQRDVQDEDRFEGERYTDQLFRKQKANKANVNLKNQPEKHRNHKYHQDYETSSAEKGYANYSNRQQWNRRKPTKQSSSYQNDRPRKTKPSTKSRHRYQQPLTMESHIQPQFLKTETRPDTDESDPMFYSTLPRDQQFAASDHDDIYSGLLSRKPSRIIVDKSKLLGDINYNRKQQTKIFTAQNNLQQQQEILQ